MVLLTAGIVVAGGVARGQDAAPTTGGGVPAALAGHAREPAAAAAGVAAPPPAWPGAPRAAPTYAATAPDGRAVTISVVDGDSVTVDGVEWRLRGFDTPEIDTAKCEAERRLGVMARARLDALIAATSAARGSVTLAGGDTTDRHKRPLGDLLVAGVNVRTALLAEGFGRLYNGGPRRGWCTRDSRDDMIPGPPPARDRARLPKGRY